MICLDCNHDNPYGLDQCAACGLSFAVRPPFVEQNHVSQLMSAVLEFQGGQIDRNTFVRRYDNFMAIYTDLDRSWQFSTPLSERLSEGLLDDDGTPRSTEVWEGLQVIDSGLELLAATTTRLKAVRNPSNRPPGPVEVALLAEAYDHLLNAFRAICAGSASLLHFLEMWQPTSDVVERRGPGSLIDVSSA